LAAADLARLDLAELDLAGLDLAGLDLAGLDLADLDLADLDLAEPASLELDCAGLDVAEPWCFERATVFNRAMSRRTSRTRAVFSNCPLARWNRRLKCSFLSLSTSSSI
jgi:uncharacterized protein YjbI with pentapeptide repeats